MSDSGDILTRMKKLSGRISLFEFFLAFFLLILYIVKPELISPLKDFVAGSSFLPYLLGLMLIFPILWAGLTVMSHKQEMSDDYDEEEDEDSEDEDLSSRPAEGPADPAAAAPYREDAFGDLPFLRVQKLSDRSSISARDRVLFLRTPGRFKILTETAVPDSAVIIEYKDDRVSIVASRSIELYPGRPLVLFSRSSAGTRIPQYALTYVSRKETGNA